MNMLLKSRISCFFLYYNLDREIVNEKIVTKVFFFNQVSAQIQIS